MKKIDIKRILLVVFAVAALFFASIPGSLKVYTMNDAQELVTMDCTYFTQIEDVNTAISLPAAALCAGIAVMLTGIYATFRKKGLLTAVRIVSMLGSILAVVPVLIKGTEVVLLPSVLVPIFLLADYVVAKLIATPTEESAQKTDGKRLK